MAELTAQTLKAGEKVRLDRYYSGGDLVFNLTNASLAYTAVFGGGWRYS